jgi:tellurite resistance protein TerC
MQVAPWVWALFGALVLAMLALDLAFDRRRRQGAEDGLVGPRPGPSLGSAALWSAAWIGLGLAFALVVLALYGPGPALTYLTAYVLEKSLSVDNIFVFVLIFGALAIPAAYQRHVLYWGIIGALAMRAVLIAAGVYLLDRFHWVIYPFGALILVAAARMLWGERQEREMVEKACAACSTWVARVIPITPVLRGDQFWIRQGGPLRATPLFIALIVVETTDVVLALDSIPAVLSISREPFLVYTSNVFAMLGLRSLYFLLAGAIERLHAVRYALAAILAFVGARMLLEGVLEIPVWTSLAVIAAALAISIAVSLGRPRRAPGSGSAEEAVRLAEAAAPR